ncbi:hypothetical protein VSU19_13675 [Verrucomicrobiales bacterium BCK34]|nr:hypothetical protein [Verrucomicrobiales bacterium BCK34]
MKLLRRFSLPPLDSSVLETIGALTAVLGGGLCGLGLIVKDGTHGVENWKIVVIPGFSFLVFGIGMSLRLMLFSVPLATILAALGGSLAVGSVFQVPFPWSLINISFGVIGCLPAFVLLRHFFKWILHG